MDSVQARGREAEMAVVEATDTSTAVLPDLQISKTVATAIRLVHGEPN